MLKRFYSKRSGFTLVEIIVAFAVFALMAAMIGQVLQLSIAMRRSNSLYAQALANQEQYLTVADKTKTEFTEDGQFKLQFTDPSIPSEASEIKFDYTMMSADEETAGRNAGEGINYFVSNIEYITESGGSMPDYSGTNFNTGTQAARQDTRITGTGGLGYVQIGKVIKDTNTYNDPTDPLYLAPGYTRYWFEVRANTSPYSSDKKNTFKDEDIPYAQYRLYFFEGSPNNSDPTVGIDPAQSSIEYTDADGKTYTKDVYKTAKIVNVGYIEKSLTESLVLTSSNTSTKPTANNIYVVQATNDFTIKISTDFHIFDKWGIGNMGIGNKGYRLMSKYASRFYVDFYDPDGTLEITTKSFGYVDEFGNENGAFEIPGEGVFYPALPVWADEYESDGTPTYYVPKDDEFHVNLYGAFINRRHYK